MILTCLNTNPVLLIKLDAINLCMWAEAHMCYKVSGRVTSLASRTVLEKGGELKNWMLNHPVKSKGALNVKI